MGRERIKFMVRKGHGTRYVLENVVAQSKERNTLLGAFG